MSGLSWGGIVVPLVVGIILGFLGQWLRYRYSRRLETKEKLAQPLDVAFNLVNDLHRDVSYVKSLMSRGPTAGSAAYSAVEDKIREIFRDFIGWHKDFGKAIELELRYRNPDLLTSLRRVLVLSNQGSDPGFKLPLYLDILEADLAFCLDQIESFYRSL